MSAFTEIASLPPTRIWQGLNARVVHGQRITLSVIEFDPGSVVTEHSHDNEQVGILVAGSLTFRIGDETREIRPGAAWCVLSNVPHDVVAGPEGAVIVEAFSPPRADDWANIERGEPTPPRWPDPA
jgi:quercetin dioxygenase-like cupin family protein